MPLAELPKFAVWNDADPLRPSCGFELEGDRREGPAGLKCNTVAGLSVYVRPKKSVEPKAETV